VAQWPSGPRVAWAVSVLLSNPPSTIQRETLLGGQYVQVPSQLGRVLLAPGPAARHHHLQRPPRQANSTYGLPSLFIFFPPTCRRTFDPLLLHLRDTLLRPAHIFSPDSV
jgi:hypothetical protein